MGFQAGRSIKPYPLLKLGCLLILMAWRIALGLYLCIFFSKDLKLVKSNIMMRIGPKHDCKLQNYLTGDAQHRLCVF